MHFEDMANIAAMIFSLIAVVTLFKASMGMDGSMSKAMKIMAVGIFMTVFSHAGVEMYIVMADANEEVFFQILGALIAVGSLAFAWASRMVLCSSR